MLLLRDLWATARARTALVGLLVLAAAMAQAVVAPLAGQVLTGRSATALTWLAAALVVKTAADLSVSLVAAGLTADWTADLRRRLCRVAFGQPLPTLEAVPVGELLDRIDGDVYQVGSELRGGGLRTAQAMATGLAAAVAAVVVWWPAGIGLLAASVVIVAGLRGRVSRIAVAREAEEEAWTDLAAVTEEAVHGQDDVRTTLGRPYVLQLYARRSAAVLERGRRVWRASAVVESIAAGVTRLAVATVVLVAAWALSAGRIDAARLTGLWLLAVTFGLTAEHISRTLPELQNALGAWARVARLAAAAQERGGDAPVREGPLEVRDLDFAYPGDADGAGSAVLHGVSLTFRPGTSYALVGRTGSGKSTLAKALVRAVETPRGRVRLGGQDVCDLDLSALRRWVAMVPQRTDILSGTLAENIALFDESLLPAAAGPVAELGLQDWVATLPDGLQTRLGEGGLTLSAGQEQLVAFARILVRDPHVVILDEATARLDPVTEQRVHRAGRRLLAGRIGIVIAHRLSSVRECDEVVVLADGRVVEAGPLETSERFAELLALSVTPATAAVVDAVPRQRATAPRRTEPPELPPVPPARTLREIVRLATNDPGFGLASLAVFLPMLALGLQGSVLPWLWDRLVDGRGSVLLPAVVLAVLLLVTLPGAYWTSVRFPEWWVRQMLRIGLGLVHGQTGPRRVSAHSPAEVVAQAGDTERAVLLADNVLDQVTTVAMLVVMSAMTGSLVPAAFFLASSVASALVAAGFGRSLAVSAQHTVQARAAFATGLASSVSAARTVKLAGAVEGVLAHLARLDAERSRRQRREIELQVWARSTPSVAAGLAPIGVWWLYLAGTVSSATALVAVSTLGAAHWLAWTTASLVSSVPSARVWTARTVAMSGVQHYSAAVPGVDLSAGTAPGPAPVVRHRLEHFALQDFTAVHTDGAVGVAGVDLTVARGEVVLLLGTVGSGKSSLLRALAGIVHHTGSLRWNGREVTDPADFLRPGQVAYVGQLPRVLTGTVAENVALGHPVLPGPALSTAQLDHDLARAAGGDGLAVPVGHKGVRLSGGQLQRLALARALAPRTELLIADDISSALDVATELEVWRALRAGGVTVVAASTKRAALALADRVVVLHEGRVLAVGPWSELEARWGRLAG